MNFFTPGAAPGQSFPVWLFLNPDEGSAGGAIYLNGDFGKDAGKVVSLHIRPPHPLVPLFIDGEEQDLNKRYTATTIGEGKWSREIFYIPEEETYWLYKPPGSSNEFRLYLTPEMIGQVVQIEEALKPPVITP